MKKVVRIVIVALALMGSIAATVDAVHADGNGGTNPICDPTTSRCTL
ncbi:MAG TPA: hypothetical protein VFU76_16090 [Terriglobales bacterium]|nr:hypothetical protein [Terriglobales bacterium]